jgi:hypothetical protein
MGDLTADDSEMHDRSCAFNVRMAGSASHFGDAFCPLVGLPIGGIGLAQQERALFGPQVSLRCQFSNVLSSGSARQ